MSTSLSQRTSSFATQARPGADATVSSPFVQLGAHPATARALARQGIETPTPIQAQTIPPLLAGRDVIGQSRTGSGKTIAFGLPLVERVDPSLRHVQALVLVPTRELASQVGDVIASLDGRHSVRVAQLVGGRPLGPQRQALLSGAQIVVGAPGRILDHLRQGNLNLRRLCVVVLDEADQMLDAGFAPDIERILAMTPPTRQMALFTATLPEWTIRIAGRYLHDPVLVKVGSGENRPTPAIAQTVYVVPQGQRLDALKALLDRRRDASGATLVFGRTKHGVKKLARQLDALGYPVAALQGNMSQTARDRVISDFRAGQVPVLLATNVAARGLDVVTIDQVINYELPESAELFTHRIGRTGRMDREGVAITLITPDDMLAWKKIQRDLGGRLQPQPWPHADMPLPELREHAGNRAGAVEQTARVSRPVPTHNPHNRMSGHADNSSDATRIARRGSRHGASMDRKRAPAHHAGDSMVR
ncbi:MAG TPA: DEAD/DEAH box helicase [Ktedonobacterales bacterium]|nr:DEAD/DEAH box helicase [Ktedonobacterales bacterium]